MGKKDELMGSLNNKAVPRVKTGFEYRTKGRNGRKKAMVTFMIDPVIEDKIERMAFHERDKWENKSVLVNAILSKYFEGKDFDPIPPKNPSLD